jgi:hypothetical protein
MFRGLIFTGALFFFSSTSVTFAQQAVVSPTSQSSSAAQEPGARNLTRLMVGVDLKETVAIGEGTANRFGVGFMWRWRSRTPRLDDRLAFAYRFGSYRTLVSSPALGQNMEVGDVRLRPIMAGAQYKMPRGKWTWSVGATVGWSINSLDTAASFRDQVMGQTGTDVATDIHNSFAWSPRVKGWYDVNRRVSVMIESSYSYSRPMLTIRSGGVDQSHRLNADALLFKAGLVYGIW